eukprot:6823413-Pyramimonas_sp.AAC.1
MLAPTGGQGGGLARTARARERRAEKTTGLNHEIHNATKYMSQRPLTVPSSEEPRPSASRPDRTPPR